MPFFFVPQALAQTRTVIDSNRPWYEALVLRKQAAEASGGKTVSGLITSLATGGLSFVVNAVNVDLLKPVCVGLQELFAAVKGATAAREELISLLSYCVSITTIVLNQALLADLPVHIKSAIRGVEAEIKGINGNARLFDTNTGCSLPCRRLRLHARDREEIQKHKVRLQEILELATQAAGFDTNAVVHETAATVESVQVALDTIMQKPPAPGMAKVPMSTLALPSSYVERTSLVSVVVSHLTAAHAAGAPYVLIGMGGGGKTVLASSVVRTKEIRERYRQGIFWVRVGRGGKDQLQALFAGLAREVSVAPRVPHQFNSVDEVIQHLTQVAVDTLPRLVVLDDVWEREVVDALQPTGLQLLMTTRRSSVVAVEGGRTVVGNMENGEARELLKSKSGAVALPETEANKVCCHVSPVRLLEICCP